MTSKTFKSVTDNESELDVRANDCGVFVAFSRAGQIRQASTFAPADAPALALAILEAAGFDGDETMFTGLAVANLRDHVEEQERATAEAEAQAKLEAEALELCDSARHAHGRFKIGNFGLMKDAEKTTWLAVARRAREINKEEK